VRLGVAGVRERGGDPHREQDENRENG
jgi:hypothetical protein